MNHVSEPAGASHIRELDTVVLLRGVPDAGLRAGDVGAVVHVHAPDAVEVEFVTESGETRALLTLPPEILRLVSPEDLTPRRQGR